MSFNRLGYDNCAYAKTLQQSIDPLDYFLFKGKYQTKTFRNLEFGIKTDVESDLQGQLRIGTRCPEKKFPYNSQNGVDYTPPIIDQSIYYITPNNLVKPTTSGLKDISAYTQNVCPIKK